MGGSISKQPCVPLSPLLTEPWRTVEWGKRDEMKEHVRRFQISTPDVKHLRILVSGPVGAGRSSFINSIDSIFQERMACGAIVETMMGHSCTNTFKAHRIKDGRYGSHLPFVMCDVMGLERGDTGVQTDDIISILEGHIKDGYVCNPRSACSVKVKGYNKYPNLEDKIHCLASVIPADTFLWCADNKLIPYHTMQGTDEELINKFRSIRKHANMLGIPQVIILSKVDEACPKVNEDIKIIYRSSMIQKKIRQCSSNLGVPMNCIFPVKCYHEEIHLNDNMDVLLLSALTIILNFANEYVAERRQR